MTAYYQPLQRQSDRRWDMTRGTGSTPAPDAREHMASALDGRKEARRR